MGTYSVIRRLVVPSLLTISLLAVWAQAQSTQPTNPFHAAAEKGDLETLQKLLTAGQDVNERDEDGRTVLHWVGGEKTAKFLIEHGAKVNVEDDGGVTPLHFAVFHRDKEWVRLLVEKGADVNAKRMRIPFDDLRYTPLDVAVEMDNRSMAEYLIDRGAEVNPHGADVTPLLIAARRGHEQMVKLLLAKGADVRGKMKEGTTVLHVSLLAGKDLAIPKLLLANGADVNARDADGQTPLHWAARRAGHATAWLIASGADINAKDKDDKTPLHYAAVNGEDVTVELLVAKKADANAKDRFGRTPLSLAEEKGHSKTAAFLKARGTEQGAAAAVALVSNECTSVRLTGVSVEQVADVVYDLGRTRVYGNVFDQKPVDIWTSGWRSILATGGGTTEWSLTGSMFGNAWGRDTVRILREKEKQILLQVKREEKSGGGLGGTIPGSFERSVREERELVQRAYWKLAEAKNGPAIGEMGDWRPASPPIVETVHDSVWVAMRGVPRASIMEFFTGRNPPFVCVKQREDGGVFERVLDRDPNSEVFADIIFPGRWKSSERVLVKQTAGDVLAVGVYVEGEQEPGGLRIGLPSGPSKLDSQYAVPMLRELLLQLAVASTRVEFVSPRPYAEGIAKSGVVTSQPR